MERGFHAEPIALSLAVEYGVSIFFSQFTQHAASIGASPIHLKCFHHVLLIHIIVVIEIVKLNFNHGFVMVQICLLKDVLRR